MIQLNDCECSNLETFVSQTKCSKIQVSFVEYEYSVAT